MPTCGHPLCQLIGDGCSLASGVSRGCQTGVRKPAPVSLDLIDEIAALLAELATDDSTERRHAAATRLAAIFRREARTGRSLLVLAADDQLEPDLAARLQFLCRRR